MALFSLGFSLSSRDIGFVVIKEMFSLILTADLSKTSSVRGQFTRSARRGTGTSLGLSQHHKLEENKAEKSRPDEPGNFCKLWTISSLFAYLPCHKKTRD